MMKIIEHAHRTKVVHLPYTFKCPNCGCVFESDEYDVGAERRMNGRRWFSIDCPECSSNIVRDVQNDEVTKYITDMDK